MREGRKLYFRHLGILVALFGVLVLVASVSLVQPKLALEVFVLFVVVFAVAFVYFALLFLGAFWRKGPLKHVGVGLLQDHENELKELKAKQPWETT